MSANKKPNRKARTVQMKVTAVVRISSANAKLPQLELTLDMANALLRGLYAISIDACSVEPLDGWLCMCLANPVATKTRPRKVKPKKEK